MLFFLLIGRSIDWLIDFAMGGSIDWLIDYAMGGLIDWLIDYAIDGLIDWLIDWSVWLAGIKGLNSSCLLCDCHKVVPIAT